MCMFARVRLLGGIQVDVFIWHKFGIHLLKKVSCNSCFFNNLEFTFLLLSALLGTSSGRTQNGVLFLPLFPSPPMIQIAK